MDQIQMDAAHKHLTGVWSTTPQSWPLWFATEAALGDVSHDPVRWCRGRKGQSKRTLRSNISQVFGRPLLGAAAVVRHRSSLSDVSHDPVRWCRRRMDSGLDWILHSKPRRLLKSSTVLPRGLPQSFAGIDVSLSRGLYRERRTRSDGRCASTSRRCCPTALRSGSCGSLQKSH
jgi:hypothetical protein